MKNSITLICDKLSARWMASGHGLAIVAALIGLLATSSCSTTRHLPDDEVLYTGISHIRYANDSAFMTDELARNEVDAALAYPPNNAFFGSSELRWPLPLGLWTYNAFANQEKGLGKWISKTFASEPVTIRDVSPGVRSKIATNLLHDYGFFGGQVTHEIIPQKNPRKAKVAYLVDAGRQFVLDSVEYIHFTGMQDTLIHQYWDERLLLKDEPFSVWQLEQERQRLKTLFQDHGYYYYQSHYITFRADTLRSPGKVWLQIVPERGLPKEVNKRWYIGNTTIHLYPPESRDKLQDSLHIRHTTLHFTGDKPPLRPRIIWHNLRMRNGQLFSAELANRSQDNMWGLGVFNAVDIRFSPRDTMAGNDTLDMVVNAVFDKPMDIELEVGATTNSNDQAGPGISLGISKKNVFRAGETFKVKMNASYEWQTGSAAVGHSAAINSWELGLSTSLTYPRLMFPGLETRRFRSAAETSFKLYANQLNRAGFFKMLSFGGSAIYTWQRKKNSRHELTPFRLTFNMLQDHTSKFDSIMDNNRALAVSFRNQFIPAVSYTYTYDDAAVSTLRHHTWWSTTVTSAGGLTSTIYAMFGKSFSERDKALLGNPFAQFFKMTTELRNLFKISGRTQLATRLMAGVIVPYGNSKYAPYSEQFYIGGGNSIRAFTARTIGPGSFRPSDNKYFYLDETGDLKLEANIEFRFPIAGNLYGATFLDAGNVWLLHRQDDRPGGELTLRSFWNDIALGTGAGVRYDLEFLVIRVDLGVALHLPYDTGKKGYYNIPRFMDGLGLHLAVGYPF